MPVFAITRESGGLRLRREVHPSLGPTPTAVIEAAMKGSLTGSAVEGHNIWVPLADGTQIRWSDIVELEVA